MEYNMKLIQDIMNNATNKLNDLFSPKAAMTKTDKHDELKKAADTLIKYLNENHHPHVTAIVTATSIELFEGLMSIPKIYDHL